MNPDEFRYSRGSALIETAMILPVLLLVILNAVNYGLYIYGWITVNNAARAALEYRVYNGVVAGFPARPTFSQVQCNPWYQDVSALPNRGTGNSTSCTWGNVTLKICNNNDGTITCSGTGSYTPPEDPEPGTYSLYSADVAYTYAPVFTAFNIPFFDVALTLPATTIHRQVVMRNMQ